MYAYLQSKQIHRKLQNGHKEKKTVKSEIHQNGYSMQAGKSSPYIMFSVDNS